MAAVYRGLLNDRSYSVIKTAALALGQTKSSGAYEALAGLLGVPSWRDQIRASALDGLTALEDRRALEAALRYAAADNTPNVRASAVKLLAAIGKGEPRVFSRVSEAFLQGVETNALALIIEGARTLAELGDARAIAVLQEVKRTAIRPGALNAINAAIQRLQTNR